MPEGSIIDFTNYNFGFENLRPDLPGLGAGGENLITDTFSTPVGDIDPSRLHAMLDASAGLSPAEGLVSFADAPCLSGSKPCSVYTSTGRLFRSARMVRGRVQFAKAVLAT